MCILSYIYGSYSLELGEDIELFCVVQDFCLVTVLLIKIGGENAKTICKSLYTIIHWSLRKFKYEGYGHYEPREICAYIVPYVISSYKIKF